MANVKEAPVSNSDCFTYKKSGTFFKVLLYNFIVFYNMHTHMHKHIHTRTHTHTKHMHTHTCEETM